MQQLTSLAAPSPLPLSPHTGGAGNDQCRRKRQAIPAAKLTRVRRPTVGTTTWGVSIREDDSTRGEEEAALGWGGGSGQQ